MQVKRLCDVCNTGFRITVALLDITDNTHVNKKFSEKIYPKFRSSHAF